MKEKCNGCGLCAEACHEGAIGMVDGKAKDCFAMITVMAWQTVSRPVRPVLSHLKNGKLPITMKQP